MMLRSNVIDKGEALKKFFFFFVNNGSVPLLSKDLVKLEMKTNFSDKTTNIMFIQKNFAGVS